MAEQCKAALQNLYAKQLGEGGGFWRPSSSRAIGVRLSRVGLNHEETCGVLYVQTFFGGYLSVIEQREAKWKEIGKVDIWVN